MPYHHRNALPARLALAVLVGLVSATDGAAADEAVSIRWRVPRDQVVELRDELQLDGSVALSDGL